MARYPTSIPADDTGQTGIPPWLRTQWREWINQVVGSKGGIALAEEAGFSQSYVSRMRKGFIPRRDVVATIGRIYKREDEALIMAGYLPHPVADLCQACRSKEEGPECP